MHHRILAGDALKPWLILGPFYKSFSNRIKTLTSFERPGFSSERDVMDEVIEEAKKILLSSPCEGQEENFLGMAERWNFVRRPEKYLSWGRYNFSNHLGAAFLTTIVTPERSGSKHFTLFTNSRALLAANGNIIFDTDAHTPKKKNNRSEYHVDVDLPSGENTLTIALFRIGRTSTVDFLIECANEEMNARVPLPEWISPTLRSEIEDEVTSLRLERDVFYPEHDIGVLIKNSSASETQLRIQSSSLDGIMLKESVSTDGGKITLCSGAELPDGEYQLTLLWESKAGQPITSVTSNIAKIVPTPALIGYERLSERKRITLEHFARSHSNFLYGELWNPVAGYILGGYEKIWTQVARYALGWYKEIDEHMIADTCQYIAERKDCSEFLMQGILRIMCWEQRTPRLSPEIRTLMKETIVGFRYWVDEPGDALMHMSSENHRLLLHVAEFLAGQLFPAEEFPNSGQRGLYHVTKGRMYLAEWLRQRGRFGLDEWHSNSYYPVDIAPLVNAYDFAPEEDYTLRHMAKQILDYLCFVLAEDTFHGIFGTTSGRSYGPYIKYPDFEYTASLCWFLYGEGSLWGGSGMGTVSLATSTYRLPEMFANIAGDYSTTIESYQRQGLLMGKEPSANFVVYRTPDYMLSGLQDYGKGDFSPQTHVAQVTFENKAIIFWSCPDTSGEGPGLRPDYWSGNIILPRVIQYRNVLALVWQQSESVWMTHCFFEPVKFDEVRLEGNWLFARVKRGYVGIFSQYGVSFGQYGRYAGRELVCYAPQNIWLVECGNEAEWGAFDKFAEALMLAQIIEEEGNIIYASPSIGKLAVGWDIEPRINGTLVKLKDYPLINSKRAYSEFGSGHTVLQYSDERREERIELWFG